MLRRLVLVLLLGVVGGCANNFARFYQGMPDARIRPGYISSVEPVRIYSSEDLQKDVRALMSKGYIAVGQSSFNADASSVNQSQLLEQASKVGAHVVLVRSRYTHTESGVMPLTLPKTTTSYSSGTATAYGPGGSVTAYGSGTTTTYGSQTTYIPYSSQRSDFNAVYLVRIKGRLGFYAIALDDDTRRKLGSNAGVRVDVVVEDSPAFVNDVLPGDIVLKFNDATIRSPEHYQELLNAYSGDAVNLTIHRDGTTLTKKLPFQRL